MPSTSDNQKQSDISFPDFLKSFNNNSGSFVKFSSTSGLVLKRAYRIHKITITDGRAEIKISDFNSRIEENAVLATFCLTYEITQLNLPHLAKYLCGHNFRINVVCTEEIKSNSTLDGKYSIQVESQHIKFK